MRVQVRWFDGLTAHTGANLLKRIEADFMFKLAVVIILLEGERLLVQRRESGQGMWAAADDDYCCLFIDGVHDGGWCGAARLLLFAALLKRVQDVILHLLLHRTRVCV